MQCHLNFKNITLMKITVIGAGNMGGAMIKGWAKHGEHELTITARTEKTLTHFK